ncbi:MAG: MBL fold metallo-hydrolase [Acidimicrobiia bacterium]
MELTVLGACGSYGAPAGGACSGYLVRAGGTAIWLDCGNGSFANLQRHLAVEDLDAVVITHQHPDHCVDLYGLHVMLTYGLGRRDLPVYAPEGLERHLGVLVNGDWGGTFAWTGLADGDAVTIGEAALVFSRTDHPPPTLAVEVTAAGRRLVYTADTGPGWSVEAFAPGADLVLSEATYQRDGQGSSFHLSAHQAGEAARAAGARRLVLTHIWPGLDPAASAVEGSEAFGQEVTLAAPHQRLRI